MHPIDFDDIAKIFAQRRLSRRQAVARTGVGLAAAALAAAGLGTPVAAAAPAEQRRAAAPTFTREETDEFIPLAAPAGGTAVATPTVSEASKPITFMFAQSFDGGSLVPVPGKSGHYTLTLPHGLGQTIFFSDRPQRIVGIVPPPVPERLGLFPGQPAQRGPDRPPGTDARGSRGGAVQSPLRHHDQHGHLRGASAARHPQAGDGLHPDPGRGGEGRAPTSMPICSSTTVRI